MSRFLQYVTELGKFVFVPVTEDQGNYDFPEINEPHIIAGFYENGQLKSLANQNITAIELYAMSNDVDFNMINPHDFHPAGRKFTFIQNEIIVQNISVEGGLPSSGLTNVVEDVTPQLGASLDVNGFGLSFGATSVMVPMADRVKFMKAPMGAGNGLTDLGNSGVKWKDIYSLSSRTGFLEVDGVIITKGIERDNIGTSVAPFNDLYIKTITGLTQLLLKVAGNTKITIDQWVTKFHQKITPHLDNSLDFGNDTNRFKGGYFYDLSAKNAATGSFTSNDGKTVTVTAGIVTGIV